MAETRAERPADGRSDSPAGTGRPVAPGRSTRARAKRKADGRKKADPAKVERARLALKLNGGNVAEAARQAQVPRTTVSRWISEGKFDPDEWEELRKERERGAVELAYEGLSAHLEELRTPHHKTISRPDGTQIDEGPALSPQVVRAQVEVIRVLGGYSKAPAKGADGEGSGDQTVRIEIVPPAWPDYDASGKIIPFRRTG